MDPKIARVMFLRLCFKREKSCMPMLKPIPMIGPMSGEMSIAPIITGILLVLSPTDAMMIANIKTNSCDPLNDTPLRISSSAFS